MKLSHIFYIIFLSAACSRSECEASKELMQLSASHGLGYCDQYKKAIDGDFESWLKLLRFSYKTDQEIAIEHGILFTKLCFKLKDAALESFVLKIDNQQALLILELFQTYEAYEEDPLGIQYELPVTYQLLQKIKKLI
jgi:hypothetical protein